jgi:hypothetical protein
VNKIKATVKAGRVEVQVPTEWVDGTEVEIHALGQPESPEDQERISPEEIASTLAAMEKVEPFDMAAAEAADLEAWERKVKEYTIANMDKGLEDVFQ